MTVPRPEDIPDGPEPISFGRLNHLQRNFVLNYVLGDDGIRGILYKSYRAAGYGSSNDNTASAAANALLKNPHIQAAIKDLRHEVEREALLRMKSWAQIAQKAQTLLERAIDTAMSPEIAKATNSETHLTPNQLYAIKEVLDRALGRPTRKVEHEVGETLADIIKKIASRRSVPMLPSGHPLDVSQEVQPPDQPA